MFRPMLSLFALAILIALGGSSCHNQRPYDDADDMSKHRHEQPRNPTAGPGEY